MEKYKLACYLSKIVYKSEYKIYEELYKMNLRNCYFIERENSACFIVQYSINEIIICFRGSNDIKDWISNLNTNKNSELNGKVHEGFKECLSALYPDIINILQYKFRKDVRIYLCGHSLGGALSLICGNRLYYSGFNVEEIYTFGQPKCFDKKYIKQASSFKIKYYRFVNNNDLVPKLPVKFKHYGTLIYINRKGEVLNKINLLSRIRDGLIGRFNTLFKHFKVDDLYDHKIDNYYNILERGIWND